ncbi:MAG: hypothetical protein RR585_02755, partial [Coprobacillus sp.]
MKRCKKVLSSVVACLMIVSLIVGGMTNPVKAEDKIVISELNVTVDFSKLSSVRVGAEIPNYIDFTNNETSEKININNENVFVQTEGWISKAVDGEWEDTYTMRGEPCGHCMGVYDDECEYAFAYAISAKEGYIFDSDLSLTSDNATVKLFGDYDTGDYNRILMVELGTVGDIENNVPVVKEEQEAPT